MFHFTYLLLEEVRCGAHLACRVSSYLSDQSHPTMRGKGGHGVWKCFRLTFLVGKKSVSQSKSQRSQRQNRSPSSHSLSGNRKIEFQTKPSKIFVHHLSNGFFMEQGKKRTTKRFKTRYTPEKRDRFLKSPRSGQHPGRDQNEIGTRYKFDNLRPLRDKTGKHSRIH